MRALTSLTTLFTLALGLAACGDDKGTTNETNPTQATDPTGTATDPTGTAGTGDSTTAGPTTMNPTTTMSPTTGDDTTAGTTDATTAMTTDATTAGMTDATTAMTTDATTGSTTDGGDSTTAGGVDLYGSCDAMANPPCPGGQQCIMIMGIEGNFCAPLCEGTSCPAMPDGVEAAPQCALTMPMQEKPTLCALVCDPMAMDECPEGQTCKQVPMQMGVGLCTAP